MLRRLLPWLLILCLLPAACVTDHTAQPYPSQPQQAAKDPSSPAPAKQSFVLGVGDSLNISVWRFDDLKRTVLVDPAGNIQFPFAGEVPAAGLSLEQLRKDLETRLARYYVNPRVDISVGQVRSQVVHVLGEVKTPSTVTMEKRTTVIEAIARAGGFGGDANEEAVLLIRDQDPEPQVFLLSLNLRSSQTSRDRGVPLASNDIIFVPPLGVVDVTRFLTHLVGVVDPFMSAGRSMLITDQVYKMFRGTGGNLLVSP